MTKPKQGRRTVAYPVDISKQATTLDIQQVYPKGSLVDQGSVFQSNRSQAVRLPKAVALPDDVKRVDVVAIGRTRILTPAGETWTSWFDGDDVTADFMAEREQPRDQEREGF